jgi:hypothetical protein
MEQVGIFYGHVIYFMAIHMVYFVVIGYVFPHFGILHQEKSRNPGMYDTLILSVRNRHFLQSKLPKIMPNFFLTLTSGLKAARKALTHELRHTVSRPGLLSQGSFCKQTLEHNCGRQRQEPVQRPPPLQQQHWRFSRLDCYVKV